MEKSLNYEIIKLQMKPKKNLSYQSTLLVFFSLFLLIFLYFRDEFQIGVFIFNEKKVLQKKEHTSYNVKCFSIYNKLSLLHSSIGKNAPISELKFFNNYKKDLKLNELPVESYWYSNQSYIDLLKESNTNTKFVSNNEIQVLLEAIQNKKPYNPYNDEYLNHMIRKHLDTDKKSITNIAIVGLYEKEWIPWIESVLISSNKNHKITLIDHKPKIYENSNIRWIHPIDYLSSVTNEFKKSLDISTKKRLVIGYIDFYGQYDAVISHFMIETIGLGRFGEFVYLNADLDTISQLHCMLKKNGLLFLTLSTSQTDSSYIEYNMKRVYAQDRIIKMFGNDWIKIDEKIYNHGAQRIIVMKKY